MDPQAGHTWDPLVSRYNNLSKDTVLNLGPLRIICSLRLLTATDASSRSMISTRASEVSFCICAGHVLSTGVGPRLALINICHPNSLQLEELNASEHQLKGQHLQHCSPQAVGTNTKDLSLCKYTFLLKEKQPAYFLWQKHAVLLQKLHREKEGKAPPWNVTSTVELKRRLVCTICIFLALLVIACSLDPYVGILAVTQQKGLRVGSCPPLYHPPSSAWTKSLGRRKESRNPQVYSDCVNTSMSETLSVKRLPNYKSFQAQSPC